MNTNTFKVLVANAVLGWASAAQAAVITVGSHTLLANAPGQQVQILVTGGEAIQGMNFNLQVADGGLAAGGTVVAPKITAVDFTTGIFGAVPSSSADSASLPQLAMHVVTTTSGTTLANGVLATVTFDTSGFTSGTWSLVAGNTRNGPTELLAFPVAPSTTFSEGSITVVVPEPSAAMAFAPAALLLRRRR